MKRLPAPATTRGLGHLARWTFDPIELLREGARIGPVFRLRLWRPVVVGYQPAWSKMVLTDLETFRSAGSLSDLTPYLAAGVVHSDVPAHDDRRRVLNPSFHSRAVAGLIDRLDDVIERHRPDGPFDAVAWAGDTVRRMLNAAFFAGRVSDRLLAEFFAPLQRPAPSPLLPRPLLFRRTNSAISAALADPVDGTLAAALAGLPAAVDDIRVALAAGFDTTAHTLAWALWHLADAPQWREPDGLPLAIDETLRLYPTGWIGSRVTARRTHVDGIDLPAGTLVMYSPYLTHRDPQLWSEPDRFKPARFVDGRPAWGFIPFGAGRRTCLGVHLARAMLIAALSGFGDGNLRQIQGDPSVKTSIALRPAGPLVIEHHRLTTPARLAAHGTHAC
jgi:cytochrome P450